VISIKKILIISPEFPPPVIGGGGIHVSNLVDKLKEYNYKIYVFAQDIYLKNIIRPKKELLTKNLILYRFPVIKIPKILYYFISIMFIIEFIKIRPNLVHGHGYPCNAVDLGALLSNFFKIPFILTLHGFPLTSTIYQFMYHKLYHNLIGRFIFKKSDWIIFVSKSLLRDYSFLLNRKIINKIRIIPNGINIKSLIENANSQQIIKKFNAKDKFILFSIGRIHKTKGFQNVIKIFPKIKIKFHNIIYLIAGKDNGYQKKLEEMIQKNNLQDNIFLLGSVSDKMKKDLYASAEIIILPSLYEPFGIVILEAMAFGKPIITSNLGGIKEILKNNFDGILINPNDEKLLLDKIIFLLENEKKRKELSKNAKNSVQRFDWDNIIKKINIIYKKTVKNL